MNRTKSPSPFRRLPGVRGIAAIAALALITAIPASAAEFTYRYYRFKTTKLINNGSNVMLSEFTFSRAGTLLNLNNRDGSGVDPVAVSVKAGDLDPNAAEGPNKLVDGLTTTKLFRGAGLADGNEIVFDFTTPVTVDAYNFATAVDSASYIRLPVSWRVAGSADGVTWTLLDARNDVPGTNTNETYQAGFELPDVVPPLINNFALHNTATEGTAAIVLNGNSVQFDYDTSFSDTRMLFQGATSTPLPTEAGNVVVTPPSNSTAPYNLVAIKEGAAAAVNTLLVRTVIGGPATYKYVRYTVTGRSGGGGGLVQVSEMQFFNGSSTDPANKKTILSATNPGGRNAVDAGEGANKLFDGDNGSKWLDNNPNVPVVFYFGETPVTFDRYLFVTGGDAVDRDPVQWKLEGSNDQTRWDLIENVNFPYPTPVARNFSSREIPLPGASLPASLEYFTGNSPQLIQGQPLTLSFSTQGVNLATDTITLTASTGAVMPAITTTYGSVVVNPTEDTTYILTVTTATGTSPEPRSFGVFIIPDPGVDTITYDDFADAGAELAFTGTTSVTAPDNALPNRLRITTEAQGQSGAAWFLKKQSVTTGFEVTFGLSLNQEHPNNFAPADGLAFVIQNSPSGTGDAGTGENGVSQNALNICFHSFGFAADPASLVEVRSGTTVLGRCVTYTQPGVELYGIPGVPDANGVTPGGFPYTLGSLSSDPAYRIRVVYKPGDLDLYLDGIAIIQNLNVNIQSIGAADATGKSFFGFTARTGGNVQNSDITDWHLNYGDFSALPPFGVVKTLFKSSTGTGAPDTVDIVWNGSATKDYDVLRTLDLALPHSSWELAVGADGVDGQVGVSINYGSLFPAAAKAFFSVHEIVK